MNCFFYLIWAFPEQTLLSELHPESRAVVSDQEVVHAIEAFVIDLRITELLPEMFQYCASHTLNPRCCGVHLISLRNSDGDSLGRDMSEKHSIHRVCHRIVRPRAPKAVEETYWENAIVICDVRGNWLVAARGSV